jgi:hypothetical protein
LLCLISLFRNVEICYSSWGQGFGFGSSWLVSSFCWSLKVWLLFFLSIWLRSTTCLFSYVLDQILSEKKKNREEVVESIHNHLRKLKEVWFFSCQRLLFLF